ncbi:MAG: zinc finger domain-containing protein, partial [Woeseiaceae bacterium]|nr:zinc finger domain-containing protein [Woeseiaceae bacterium]
LLLDQRFLAGNGNYLRSEILWSAAVDPAARPGALPPSALERLAMATLRIARRSYRTGGITVPAKRLARLRSRGLRYPRYRFNVFGREGDACYRCDSVIERRSMGSRNLFVCPGCQAA